MATFDATDQRAHAAAWLDLLSGAGSPQQPIELPVLSGSMAPAIPAGATLLVVAATWDTTRTGDVVIVRTGTTLVAHRRLLSGRLAGRSTVYQKGDANPSGQWTAGERIVGVATGVRNPDGAWTDLTTAAARAAGRRLAQNSLAADLRHRLVTAARRMRTWLKASMRNID